VQIYDNQINNGKGKKTTVDEVRVWLQVKPWLIGVHP